MIHTHKYSIRRVWFDIYIIQYVVKNLATHTTFNIERWQYREIKKMRSEEEIDKYLIKYDPFSPKEWREELIDKQTTKKDSYSRFF